MKAELVCSVAIRLRSLNHHRPSAIPSKKPERFTSREVLAKVREFEEARTIFHAADNNSPHHSVWTSIAVHQPGTGPLEQVVRCCSITWSSSLDCSFFRVTLRLF